MCAICGQNGKHGHLKFTLSELEALALCGGKEQLLAHEGHGRVLWQHDLVKTSVRLGQRVVFHIYAFCEVQGGLIAVHRDARRASEER